jgi:hypothetical protein
LFKNLKSGDELAETEPCAFDFVYRWFTFCGLILISGGLKAPKLQRSCILIRKKP